MVQYFEDIEEGSTYEHGSIHVTEDDIIEFAEQFDPQPFHTDPDAAEESMFGELVASGWHTGSLCMRLWAETAAELDWATGIGKGVEELKWLKPLRAGDTLWIEFLITDKYPAEHTDTYGNVDVRIRGYNQHDECIITLLSLGTIKRRPTED